VGASTDVTRAPPGAKPGGSVTDTVTVRMAIAGIDKKNSTVTLRDPDGVESVVKVRDPSKLDQVSVGDRDRGRQGSEEVASARSVRRRTGRLGAGPPLPHVGGPPSG
jgi:hypothetical protein